MTELQLSRVAALGWRYEAGFVPAPLARVLALPRSERVPFAAPAPAVPRLVRWSCRSRQQPQAALSLNPLLLSCQLRLPERESSRKWRSALRSAYGRQTLAQSCHPDRTTRVAL